MLVDRSAENLVGKKREKNGRIVFVTLNLSTSSILAVLPEVTHVWKKDGATLGKKTINFIIIIIISIIIISISIITTIIIITITIVINNLPHSKRLCGHVGALGLAVGRDDPECAKQKNQQVLQHDVDGCDNMGIRKRPVNRRAASQRAR